MLFQVAEFTYNIEDETVCLQFPHELPVDCPHPIHVEYTGVLNNQMRGFYRSKYVNTDGEDRYAAVTQFEVCQY